MDVKVTASVIFVGYADYWSGNSRRWDEDAGCLFAQYGCNETIGSIISSAMCDSMDSSDTCDKPLWERVDDESLRQSLVDCFRSDVSLDDVFEPSTEVEDCVDELPVVIFLVELETE